MRKIVCVFLLVTTVMAMSSCYGGAEDSLNNTITTTDNITTPEITSDPKTTGTISPNKPTRYTALEVGGYDYPSDAIHNVEINMNTDSITDQQMIGSYRNIQVDGFEYQATYTETQNTPIYRGKMNLFEYHDTEAGVSLEVGINATTGEMDRFSMFDRFHAQKNIGNTPLSRDKCLTIARNYLKSRVDDISPYELTYEKYVEAPEVTGEYIFILNRFVDGIKTGDQARISVTVYGTIDFYWLFSIGEMSEAVAPSTSDMKNIQQAIETKMSEIYDNVKDCYVIEYDVDDMMLIRLEDGRYAMDVYLDVELLPIDSSVIGHAELTRLIVCLE